LSATTTERAANVPHNTSRFGGERGGTSRVWRATLLASVRQHCGKCAERTVRKLRESESSGDGQRHLAGVEADWKNATRRILVPTQATTCGPTPTQPTKCVTIIIATTETSIPVVTGKLRK